MNNLWETQQKSDFTSRLKKGKHLLFPEAGKSTCPVDVCLSDVWLEHVSKFNFYFLSFHEYIANFNVYIFVVFFITGYIYLCNLSF